MGGDGDTTGHKALIDAQPKMLPPKLGKLPLVPIIDLKCETNLNEEIFKGDPGSIFIGNCPANCASTSG